MQIAITQACFDFLLAFDSPTTPPDQLTSKDSSELFEPQPKRIKKEKTRITIDVFGLCQAFVYASLAGKFFQAAGYFVRGSDDLRRSPAVLRVPSLRQSRVPDHSRRIESGPSVLGNTGMTCEWRSA